MPHHLTSWARWWFAFLGIWLLLVGSYEVVELVAGLVAAAVAAALIEINYAVGLMRIRFQYDVLRLIYRLPLRLLRDSWMLIVVLWRLCIHRCPADGAFSTVPCRSDFSHDESAAGRAITTIAISFLPNSYVVEIDERRNTLLRHELAPRNRDELM